MRECTRHRGNRTSRCSTKRRDLPASIPIISARRVAATRTVNSTVWLSWRRTGLSSSSSSSLSLISNVVAVRCHCWRCGPAQPPPAPTQLSRTLWRAPGGRSRTASGEKEKAVPLPGQSMPEQRAFSQRSASAGRRRQLTGQALAFNHSKDRSWGPPTAVNSTSSGLRMRSRDSGNRSNHFL